MFDEYVPLDDTKDNGHAPVNQTLTPQCVRLARLLW